MRCSCPCRCHASWNWQIAAESMDVIEAATACDSCRNAHCEVLLTKHLWHVPASPPAFPPPFQFVAPEGDE